MYYHFYEEDYNIGEHEGIRTDRYKLIHFYYPEDAWELYDLVNDPGEMKKLIQYPQLEDVRVDLSRELDSLKQYYRVGQATKSKIEILTDQRMPKR